MAKNSIRDYSATNSSNTDIQSIDISEGCSPAGINNAIREVMADLKDVSTGAVALESPEADSLTVTGDLTVDTSTLKVDSTNNRVGIANASPSVELDVTGAAKVSGDLTVDTDTLYVDSTNNRVGINQASPSHPIHVGTSDLILDSSGNLLVGRTTFVSGNEGVALFPTGLAKLERDSNSALIVNRMTNDGNIAVFQKDGTTVGSIGSRVSYIYIGSSSVQETYIGFNNNYVYPANSSGNFKDNAIDLGNASARYDDVFATNGTIITSDANEKQQIASLTAAEITAAKAISKLFKTFKWNSAVEAKGDAARTHTGVIAQDVQAAMTDAGLDAGNYAFFISTTWWETQTEVPAVAEETDEDGNVITEAQEAYTRTDTYETAEEAPEGATERTRLGIRYPELLAFVGAATEQRLADIETRLTALENA